MTYRGKVKDGTIELEPGIELPEGAVVRIELEPREVPQDQEAPDPLWEMTKLATETNIRDLAANVDHHLSGHPKVSGSPRPKSILEVPLHDGGALLKPWSREELMDEMLDP